MTGGRVSEEFVEACARSLVARTRARQEAAERRAEALRSRAGRAARDLAERFGVTRVWLFGSLHWGSPDLDSDVDLLVEGLAVADWARASALAEQVCEAPVDLVRGEEAPASLLTRVRREGALLHGPR